MEPQSTGEDHAVELLAYPAARVQGTVGADARRAISPLDSCADRAS
ncbi:hypothetical protein GS889_12470 [Rhodococcus hoagii]|nr:hypothetical protein [Prescottella equi]